MKSDNAARTTSMPLPVFASPQGEAAAMAAYEAVMQQWPVSFDDLMVPTSFGETHVIASGPPDGRPIVLLHAFMATAASWYRNVEALSESHRVYCVDVIGDANKSRPTRPITSPGDFPRWFEDVLDGLGIETTDIVGNSMGGFIAVLSALGLGPRISRLSPSSAPPRPSTGSCRSTSTCSSRRPCTWPSRDSLGPDAR